MTKKQLFIKCQLKTDEIVFLSKMQTVILLQSLFHPVGPGIFTIGFFLCCTCAGFCINPNTGKIIAEGLCEKDASEGWLICIPVVEP